MHAGFAGVVSPVFVGRDAELAVARTLSIGPSLPTPGCCSSPAKQESARPASSTRRLDYAKQHGMQVLSGHCVQLGTEGLPVRADRRSAARAHPATPGREQLDEVLGPARELVSRLIPTLGETPRERRPR